MTQGVRYKFQGSELQVQSGFGGAKVITAVTKADPAVVSSTTHGFVTADVVKITSVSGMTQLNGFLYVVDNETAGTYELSGVDSTDYTTFATGSPADGNAVPVVFTDFCELTGANQQDGAADQIEVTTICSDAKEFEQGLSDSGTLQLDYNAAPLSAVQTALRTAKVDGTQLAVRIIFPNSGGTVIVIGTVQQQSISGQVNGVWSGSATLKLTGPIFVL